MADPKALIPAPSRQLAADRDLEVVRRADDRLRRKTVAIMDHQASAADLNDDGTHVDPRVELEADGRPKGWSPRKFRIARDSRRPEREQPGYLARATRVYESYQRRAVEEKPDNVMHVVHTIHLSPAAREKLASYRVIDVDADGEHKG